MVSDVSLKEEALKEHLLLMIRDIDEICRKHKIKYSLSGGTALGYHMYQGFIPWDDDIDLMMTRENYEKFLRIAKEELPKYYVIKNFENGLYKGVLYSKLVDERTTAVELTIDNRKILGGVFIDIAVFDRLPKKNTTRFLWWWLVQLLRCCSEKKFIKVASIEDFIRNVGVFLVRPFAELIYKYSKCIFTSNRNEDYDYAEMMSGIFIPYRKEIFDTYIDISFCGTKTMIVKEYVEYLERRYDTKTFYKPTVKEEVKNHYIYTDVTKSYHVSVQESNKELEELLCGMKNGKRKY